MLRNTELSPGHTLSEHPMGRYPERYAPLDDEIRRAIITHFKGHIARAFEVLKADVAYFNDQSDGVVSLSSFYRIMRGEPCTLEQAQKVELVWCLFDKYRRLVPIPDTIEGLKDWLKEEFGSLKAARAQLFPDWRYSTLTGVLNGYGDQARIAEIRTRMGNHLAQAREEKRREREEA